jgi:hypothetical protein
MLHTNILLSTSNKNKIKEFKRFGLTFDIMKGKDIKEVNGSIEEVILHKALDSGEGILVEDSVLIINGEEVVDIRWKIKELSTMENVDIKWVVSLGILDQGFVYIYKSEIICKLIDNLNENDIPEDSFGFDAYIKPLDSDVSFYHLDQQGKKDLYSPRNHVVHNLLNKRYFAKVSAKQVPKWTGTYQNS